MGSVNFGAKFDSLVKYNYRAWFLTKWYRYEFWFLGVDDVRNAYAKYVWNKIFTFYNVLKSHLGHKRTWQSFSERSDALKGGAYPAHARLLWKVISLQLFAAETCNKFLKIEHHDSIVYRKNVTFLAGATSQSSNLTVGNTTQEPLDLPAWFLQQILLFSYSTM